MTWYTQIILNEFADIVEIQEIDAVNGLKLDVEDVQDPTQVECGHNRRSGFARTGTLVFQRALLLVFDIDLHVGVFGFIAALDQLLALGCFPLFAQRHSLCLCVYVHKIHTHSRLIVQSLSWPNYKVATTRAFSTKATHAKMDDVVAFLDPKKPDGESSAINWTTMALTLGFFPAFVSFQQAITESINYSLPQPSSGITWINSLGNSTAVQCYAPISTTERVGWAWGIFALLIAFGFVWALMVLWIHAHVYEWHKYARRADAQLSRGERLYILKQELALKKAKEKQKAPETEEEKIELLKT